MAVTELGQQTGKRRFFKLNAKSCELVESIKDVDWRKDVPRKWIEWKFVKVLLENKEYEWKSTEFIRLILQDWEETYEIGTSWSTVGQSLINSLAWTVEKGTLGNVSVSMWYKEVDEKKYPRLYIKNNAENTTRMYSIEEQKEMIETILNKKWEYVSRDYSTYIEKLKSHLDKINANEDVF